MAVLRSETPKAPALAGGVDLAYVRAWFGRYWLALWFGLIDLGLLSTKAAAVPFFDGRLYLDATRAWLAGGDPWMVSLQGEYFAAPPPTLLVLAPFTMLGLPALVLTIALAAIATIRMLRLPWYWLLFPPLLEGVWSANIHVWLVPLLLTRAAPLAVFAKVYAGVPLFLLDRRRAVIATALLLTLTIPILPWATFLADLPAIAGYYAEQSNYRIPLPTLAVLAPFGLWALWRVGREQAAWLSVPAFFGYQWYYATLVMPIKLPFVAALAALPVSGSGMLALLTLGVVEGLSRSGRWSRRTVPGPAGRPSSP